MQAIKREAPYIWVTWLTRLLVGKDSCVWAAWFRSNYKDYLKTPNSFDSSAWNIRHTAFLDTVEKEYRQRFPIVKREHQNAFQYQGSSGAILAGKPDLVAINPTEARICDVKTGQRCDEHWAQMLLYLYFFPKCYPQIFNGLNITGELVYPDGKQEVYMEELTDTFRNRVIDLLKKITCSEPPMKVPSASECSFCHITATDCAERTTERLQNRQEELGDF